MSPRAAIRRWLDARYPTATIADVLAHQAHKPLPDHVSWWHTFGSLALFLLVNQFVTGVLLMVYFRPTAADAFESVRFISVRAQFGWLIRGLHARGADLMIVVLTLHAFRTFWMGAYKRPREATWVVGVLILAVMLAFGFTGSLLPWNQLAYWATTVGTEVAGALPLMGESFKMLLRGGEGVSEETLGRFYLAHVVILPWVIVPLVGLHLVLVRWQGITPREPVGQERPLEPGRAIPFWPHHALRELTVFPLFLLALLAIVVWFPAEVGEKADPLRTPPGIKPEWYFLPAYQVLKYVPKLAGVLVVQLPILCLLLWPFLDRTPARAARERPWSATIGVVALLATIVLGVLGWASERTFQVGSREIVVDNFGVPRLAGRDK